jgi:protein tyrosine/serine phosphatase
MNNLGLIPLRNFAVVNEERKIYRSAPPNYAYEFKWLQEVLGIKTMVNLRSERDTDHRFCSLYDMRDFTYLVKDHFPPTFEQARHFMKLIQNHKEPLLFHCEHGRGRTSTFCVLANMALGMSLHRAIEEEKEKYHYSFQHHAQLEFLEHLEKHIKASVL